MKFFKRILFLVAACFSLGFAAAETTVYDSSVYLEWYPTVTVDASRFSGFKSGDKIIFSYENISASYHQIKIYSGDWFGLYNGNLTGAKNQGGSFIPDSDSGTIVYAVTKEEAKSVKKSGLRFHGYGMKINGIKISSGSNQSAETKSDAKSTEKKSETSVSSNPKPTSVTGTPFANHGALHVNGAYLYDKNNKKYQLYGMSTHGINFGNDFSRYVNKNAFQTLRDDWNTNCVRLVLYPRDYNGYCNGGNKSELKKIVCNGIDWATELGMYVIVDWHVHQYRPSETQSDAISFLDEISKKYSKYENVLYEICNEPTNSPWNTEIKPYAEKVIPVIRKNAPNAVVLVGTDTWSQDIEGPLSNPLSYKNVMYVFHFYANTHKDSYRTRVENAIKKGLPIFISEFGTCDASGNGGFNSAESKKWFDLCAKYNISHMNWSLSNKAETASAISSSCSKTGGWTYSDLTQSGKLIYDHFRNLSR